MKQFISYVNYFSSTFIVIQFINCFSLLNSIYFATFAGASDSSMRRLSAVHDSEWIEGGVGVC
jgi:hypothetical protein